MSEVQQRLLYSNVNPAPDWIRSIRASGERVWRDAVWPTRKREDWKYTSLKSLEQFVSAQRVAETPVAREDVADRETIDLDAYKMVFVNGVYDAERSTLTSLPEGVMLTRFEDADDAQLQRIQQRLNQHVDFQRHSFAALNNAVLTDGVYLRVAEGVRLDKPLLVLHIGHAGVAQSAPRLLMDVERSGRAELIEHFLSSDESANHFACGLSEIFIGENASVEHYRLHCEQHMHIGGVHVSLQRNARLNGFHLALGSPIQRIDLVVQHLGEGAECELNGLYLPDDGQLVDYHTSIEHAVPNCTTNEVFRGIVGGTGRAVFNGRIHIHPLAQKTLAQLNNRNLLTSPKAEVDTKPELEIYADDVQCAHGATVAQLDETAMHYFRTRGISRSEAEVMLSFGFINELLNTVRLQPVAAYLRPMLASRFARDDVLLRHIAS